MMRTHIWQMLLDMRFTLLRHLRPLFNQQTYEKIILDISVVI